MVTGLRKDLDGKYVFKLDENLSALWMDWENFIGFGDEEFLEKFLTLMKFSKIEWTGSHFLVNQMNDEYRISNHPAPPVLYSPNGDELCRRFTVTQLYYCLLNHLTLNHYDEIVPSTNVKGKPKGLGKHKVALK